MSLLSKVAGNLFALRNIGCLSYKNPSQTKRFKSLFTQFKRFKATERTYKIKDNIPDEYNLIYRNTMSNYLFGAQIISCVSCSLVAIYVCLAEQSLQTYEPHMSTWEVQPIPVDNEILIYITAIFLFSVAMQYVIKKMPIRIYNYPKNEKYVFIYYNVLPSFTKRATCELKEIRKLPFNEDSLALTPWRDHRYDVHNNHGTILLDTFFKSPAELNIMLGIQKRFVDENDTK